jgi:stearoyl-CoA desaturase (delta-9 desaturase)
MRSRPLIERYAKDVMPDPLYAMLERGKNWIKLSFLLWLVVFAAGFGAAVILGDTAALAAQFGASLVVWGGALIVIVWHTTCSVNSAPISGAIETTRRPIIAGGEGWHNNHHADPASARHGHHWWEVDFTWWMIRILMRLGLATKVSLPSPNIDAKYALRLDFSTGTGP